MPYWIIQFFKRYWKHILGIACVIGIALYIKSSQTEWARKYSDLQKQHQQEIRDIEKIRSEEQDKLQKNYDDLQKELSDLQLAYEQQKILLEKRKVENIKNIVKDTNSDPTKLAEQLSSATGIVVK